MEEESLNQPSKAKEEAKVLNPQADETPAGVNLEELLPKDIYGFIKMYASILAGQAWIYLGLTFNPATQSLTKDLKQAKAAIDCLDALLTPMESFLTAQEITDFKNIVANLKLNFIEQGKASV
jgi:hypothetical protein